MNPRYRSENAVSYAQTLSPPAQAGSVPQMDYDDAPLRPFHLRVCVASTGGVFADGFGLGIIGIALSLAAPELRLGAVWIGLIGGASLAGLFAGALVTGPTADRFGRRPIFACNMLCVAALSALQFSVASITGGSCSCCGSGSVSCSARTTGQQDVADGIRAAARARPHSWTFIGGLGGRLRLRLPGGLRAQFTRPAVVALDAAGERSALPASSRSTAHHPAGIPRCGSPTMTAPTRRPAWCARSSVPTSARRRGTDRPPLNWTGRWRQLLSARSRPAPCSAARSSPVR